MAATRPAPISYRPTEQDRRTFERAHLTPSAAIRAGLRLLEAELDTRQSHNQSILARIRSWASDGPVPTATTSDILDALEDGRR